MRAVCIFAIFFCGIMLMGCSGKSVELQVSTPVSTPKAAEASPSSDAAPVATQAPALIKIGPADELQIYVRADGAPGMYLDRDGALKGFYVDLEKMIMAEMGQKYRMHSYDNVGPLIQGLKTGQVHSGLAVPDLPDYRALMNLSAAFETLQFITFVRRGNKDIKGTTRDAIIASMAGKKVGVQTRGHIYQALRDYKDITLVEYATTTQAMADLATDKLDAVPEVLENGLYYAKLNKWNVVPVGNPVVELSNTTGFSQLLEPSVVERYNKALRAIKADGRFKKLNDDYLKSLGK
jgi:polar amino acid transport system substrate-binding protein